MNRQEKGAHLFALVWVATILVVVWGATNALGKPTSRSNTFVDVPLTLLLTSDLGGRLRKFNCPKIRTSYRPQQLDMANMLWQVDRIRRELRERRVPRHLLFNTGDNLAPQQEARFLLQFEGIAGVDLLASVFRMFRYDLIGLGNHEFSVPREKLRSFLRRARIYGLTFAASNIVEVEKGHELHGLINRDIDTNQKRPFFVFQTQPYKKVRLRIAAFHLVKKKMPVSSSRLKGLKVEDPYAYARKVVAQIKKLKPKVDLVVALSHLESRSSKGKHVKRLVNEVGGIDLILTNELREGNSRLRGLAYVSTNGQRVHVVGGVPQYKMLGRVDLKIRKTPGKSSKILSVDVRGVPLQMQRYDYNLRRKLVIWERALCRYWGKPLGKGRIRKNQSMRYDLFVKYILNLMRRITSSEIAVINEGAIRRGPFPFRHFVSREDLYRAMLFNSKLVVLEAQGQQLKQWLQSSPTSKEKLKATGWTGGSINGRPLKPQKYYRVVTIDYVVQLWRNQILGGIQLQQNQLKSVASLSNMYRKQRARMTKDVTAIRLGRTTYPTKQLAQVKALQAQINKRQQRTKPPLTSADKAWIQKQYGVLGRLQMRLYSSESYAAGKIKKIQQEIATLKAKAAAARKKKQMATMYTSQLPYKRQELQREKEQLVRMQQQNRQKEEQYENFLRRWPFQQKSLKQQKEMAVKQLANLRKKLKDFDRHWRIVTYRGCPKVTFGERCSTRCCPKIRTLMVQHFSQDGYRKWGPVAPPVPYAQPGQPKKVPKPFGPNEVPHTGNTYNLNQSFGWDLDIDFSLRFDANFISPDNLIGAFAYQRITSEFFRQFQIAGDLKVTLNAGTLWHQWKTVTQVQYGAYIRSQYDQSQAPPEVNEVFDEAMDKVLLSTQYQFRRWQWFRPLVRFKLDTEITRNRRPNIDNEEFYRRLNQFRFRHLAVEAEAGFDIDAIRNMLTFKMALTYTREFALELTPVPGSAEFRQFPNLGGFPDTNNQPGLTVSYRTGMIKLFQVGKRQSTFQSRGSYNLRLSIPSVFVEEQGILIIHDIELNNTFAFAITENISLKLEFKAIIYRGTIQRPPEFGKPNNIQLRTQGPWAFWLVPTLAFALKWGTRGQTY